MFYGGGFLAFILFAIWVWAVFDVISSDELLVRNLPKLYWVFIVLLVPTVGAIAWFAVGRPPAAASSSRSEGTERSPPLPRKSPPAPDDSPEFLKSIGDPQHLAAWEEDLKRREEELRRRRRETPEEDEDPA